MKWAAVLISSIIFMFAIVGAVFTGKVMAIKVQEWTECSK